MDLVLTHHDWHHKLASPLCWTKARESSGVPRDRDGPTVDAAERQNGWLVVRSQGLAIGTT